MFYINVSSPSGLMFHLRLLLPHGLCLNDVDVSGVLKPPTVNTLLSVSHVKSVSHCFIYLGEFS